MKLTKDNTKAMYSEKMKHYAVFLIDVKNQDESIQAWEQILSDNKLRELLEKEDPNAYVLVKSILKESKND